MTDERNINVWLAALIELYENAKKLSVELVFEGPLLIYPKHLQHTSLWAADTLYRFIELAPHVIDKNDELLFLRKLSPEKFTAHYPIGEDDTDKYLQFYGKVLDAKTETVNHYWRDFCQSIRVWFEKLEADHSHEDSKQWCANGETHGRFWWECTSLMCSICERLRDELLVLAAQYPYVALTVVRYDIIDFRFAFLRDASAIGPYIPTKEDIWWLAAGSLGIELKLVPGTLKVKLDSPSYVCCEFTPDGREPVEFGTENFGMQSHEAVLFQTWSYSKGEFNGPLQSENTAYWFIENAHNLEATATGIIEECILPFLKLKDFYELWRNAIRVLRNGLPYWKPGKVQWTYIRELDETIRNFEYANKLSELNRESKATKRHNAKHQTTQKKSDKL